MLLILQIIFFVHVCVLFLFPPTCSTPTCLFQAELNHRSFLELNLQTCNLMWCLTQQEKRLLVIPPMKSETIWGKWIAAVWKCYYNLEVCVSSFKIFDSPPLLHYVKAFKVFHNFPIAFGFITLSTFIWSLPH